MSKDHFSTNDIDDAQKRGWTVKQLHDAAKMANDAVLKSGHKVGFVFFVDCAAGAVRATSYAIARGCYGHPSCVATVYRDGSLIVNGGAA